MLESIRSIFGRRMTDDAPDPGVPESPESGLSPIQVAACALLLELAWADDEFAESERAQLLHTIERQFALDPDGAAELIAAAEAERREAVDLFQFTSLIAREYDEARKMVLLEAMWGLVYADGMVEKHESYLMRKVSKLLDVRPGFLGEARRKVRAAHPDPDSGAGA